MSSTPVTRITRRHLFDLLWSKPVTTIARDLGTSGYHVSALARRLALPLPAQGHWMKLEAGKAPTIPSYPTDAGLDEGEHEIGHPVIRKPPTKRKVPEGAQHNAESDGQAAARGSAVSAPPPASADDAATTPLPAEPHRLVAATRAASKKVGLQGRTRIHGAGRFNLLVSAGQVERACAILDDLVRAVEARGDEIAAADDGLVFRSGEETIGFLIEEQLNSVPHVPTATELREKADYDRQCERADRGIGHRPWKQIAIPTHDAVPGGKLVLQFDQKYSLNGARRTFSDGKHQRLETLIEAIADSLRQGAAGLKARQEEQERWRREHEAREAERRHRENVARLESYRIAFLRKQIERGTEIDGLDALLARWEGAADTDPGFLALLDFARSWRARLDAMLHPDAISSRLSKLRLMSDDIYIYDLARIE